MNVVTLVSISPLRLTPPLTALIHRHRLYNSLGATVVARDQILRAFTDTSFAVLTRRVVDLGDNVSMGSCIAAGCVDGARQVAGVHGVEEVEDPTHGQGDDCEV